MAAETETGEATLTVDELAARAGVTVRTVRFQQPPGAVEAHGADGHPGPGGQLVHRQGRFPGLRLRGHGRHLALCSAPVGVEQYCCATGAVKPAAGPPPPRAGGGGRPPPAPPAAPAPQGAEGVTARTRRAGFLRKARRTADTGPAPAAAAAGLAVRHGRLVALRDVNLSVRAGETVALMGRNGAGKSTLLRTLVGMHKPAAGSVRVGGAAPQSTTPAELLRHVGLVPQEPRDLLYADTVAAECAAADGDAGAEPGTCRALVSRLLPDVPGTTHPRDLSEGQRLALALAVVLTASPPLILLDEPTRGLDYAAKHRLVEILRGLAAEGHAIVLATHDVELAAELAHRVVVIADGEIVADGPTAEVVVSSPAFAPQVAKVLAPQPWLTVGQVRDALEAGS